MLHKGIVALLGWGQHLDSIYSDEGSSLHLDPVTGLDNVEDLIILQASLVENPNLGYRSIAQDVGVNNDATPQSYPVR